MKQHTVIKNSLITAGILGAATGFCFLIQEAAESDTHVPLLFVLAVLFISRFTDGYIYGIVASMIAVVGVNYVFTYPYFAIDFTITGYPVTFIAMLAVACSVSALTTQIKKQEQIRLEAEKEKMRGNLLRAVSHDIRTPLTSIMGAASVVLENYGELSDEKRMDFLKDIREESQWLIQIVENLLSITRIGDNGGSASIDKQEEMVEDADIVLVAYGTTSRIARSAMRKCREQGVRVGLIRPITLWPFPEAAIRATLPTAKKYLCVEMSMGQMIDDVRLAVNGERPVEFYGRTGGMVPTVKEIVDHIMGMAQPSGFAGQVDQAIGSMGEKLGEMGRKLDEKLNSPEFVEKTEALKKQAADVAGKAADGLAKGATLMAEGIGKAIDAIKKSIDGDQNPKGGDR